MCLLLLMFRWLGLTMVLVLRNLLDDKEWKFLSYYSVDEDYIQNMGLTLLAGKFFSKEAGISNKNFIVLNEEAVKSFQFENALDAIGKSLIIQEDSTETTGNWCGEELSARIIW